MLLTGSGNGKTHIYRMCSLDMYGMCSLAVLYRMCSLDIYIQNVFSGYVRNVFSCCAMVLIDGHCHFA